MPDRPRPFSKYSATYNVLSLVAEVQSHNRYSHYASVPKHVQVLQIQEVHPVVHPAILAIFLTWSSRTPNKDQKTEQLFCILLVHVL